MRNTTRLLTRHFFRRFIENDLISPDADRHQTLAVASACVISFGLVVTMLLAVKYLTALPTPGQVSLLSLDDKFLYMGWSMAVMALVTLGEWDALSLDARDASILGPLPIDRRTILRAKALALAIFAGGCIAALNLVPTIVYASATASKLVGISPLGYATLIAVHAAASTAAGSFGFLSVLGVRELLRALLGAAGFGRVSSILQAALVLSVVVFLCVLPSLSSRVGRVRLAPASLNSAMPPLWFLGAYEVGAGHVIDRLDRRAVPRRLVPFDRDATTIYRSRQPALWRLGGIALIALSLAGITAAGAYTWNNRRLPSPVGLLPNAAGSLAPIFARVMARSVVRRPLARAGFFLTIQTLWRSAPHRLTMAVAAAVALAIATISARGSDVLAIQSLALVVLIAAFRHAARVPGDLRANWVFQLAWSGESADYLEGVKRAALVSVAFPLLLVMFPMYAALLGAGHALLHVLLGALMANLIVEIAMLGFRTPPFASSYAGNNGAKAVVPVLVCGLVAAEVLAKLEQRAMDTAGGIVLLAVALVALAIAVRNVQRRQRQGYGPIDFYELPGEAQRLDLTA